MNAVDIQGERSVVGGCKGGEPVQSEILIDSEKRYIWWAGWLKYRGGCCGASRCERTEKDEYKEKREMKAKAVEEEI